MKVRIKAAPPKKAYTSDPDQKPVIGGWYDNMIGQAVEVYDFSEDLYKTSYAQDPYKDWMFLRKEDCEVLK